MYAAAVEPRPAEVPRWARGCAVALVTAPGVLLAHLLTAGSAPSVPAVLLVAAVVALVSCAVPAGGPRSTAVVAAAAQLAGHAALALAVPRDAAGGGCLSVVGRGADALVNPSAACPPGAAVPPGGPAVLAAVVAAAGAAALVLAGSGLLAAVRAALVVALAAGAAAVRALVAAVVPVLVGADLLRLPVRRVPPPPAPAPVPLRSLWRPGTPARRGPPPALAAA